MDLAEQIEFLKSEIVLRRWYFAKWTPAEKRTQEEAEYQVKAMEAVLQTLLDLQQQQLELNTKYRLYQSFLDHYYAWHLEVNKIKPRIDSRQGKALNQIIAYLLKESNDQSEEGAFKSFKYILSKWSTLNDFIRGQPSLFQINENLVEIITKIRLQNGNKLGGSQQAALARLQERAAQSSGDTSGVTGGS